jgi:hypothetical protein
MACLIHRERNLLLPFDHKSPLIPVMQEPLHHGWDSGTELEEEFEAGLCETVVGDVVLYDL